MATSSDPRVDAYLENVEDPKFREALANLRDLIRSSVPEAVEGIHYGMPGYKLGKYLAGFAAFKKHCSFFPAGIADQFASDLSGFEMSKGTIRFTPDRPIPDDVVVKILTARVSEILSRPR